MHNIGELLLQVSLPDECSLIALAIESGEPRLSAQREVFGFDYSQVGVELAKHWDFSAIFCDAIEQQLDPLSYDPVSHAAILIRLSVFASFTCEAKLPTDLIVSRFPPQLLQHINLNTTGVAEELLLVSEQGKELASYIAE